MDLTESEVRELFPEDRGTDVEQTDAQSWVSIERTDIGWDVIVGDDSWTIPAHRESDLVDELGDRLDRDVVFWDIFVDPSVTRSVCLTVTDRNT